MLFYRGLFYLFGFFVKGSREKYRRQEYRRKGTSGSCSFTLHSSAALCLSWYLAASFVFVGRSTLLVVAAPVIDLEGF